MNEPVKKKSGGVLAESGCAPRTQEMEGLREVEERMQMDGLEWVVGECRISKS
jgi:hypothetical protein